MYKKYNDTIVNLKDSLVNKNKQIYVKNDSINNLKNEKKYMNQVEINSISDAAYKQTSRTFFLFFVIGTILISVMTK